MTPAELLNEVARFWAKVDKSGDCWLWTGEKNNRGYGRFYVWHNRGRYRCMAHRIALEFAGTPLADDDIVMHSCDAPACVNPSHLSIGTQQANMQDAKAKGRINTDGLFAGARRACRSCGSVFIGSPNRRYCDDHRPRSRKAAA